MQMEFYWAYADYEQGMNLVKEMYRKVAQEVLGTQKFKTNGFEVDFSKEWKKIDYVSEIEKQTGINYFKASREEIKNKLDELDIEYEKDLAKERLADLLWKHCRQNIAGPAFLVNLPVEVSPLAKRKEQDPRLVERFIVIFGGSEIGNGYSELNDPIDQEQRFKRQQAMRDQGDEEAQMHDEDFVEALEYAMPPTCGFGTSLRFFAFLVDRPIKECQIFPLMKPKEDENG
jgi:lysyl-tRNA synthetase class 2